MCQLFAKHNLTNDYDIDRPGAWVANICRVGIPNKLAPIINEINLTLIYETNQIFANVCKVIDHPEEVEKLLMLIRSSPALENDAKINTLNKKSLKCV